MFTKNGRKMHILQYLLGTDIGKLIVTFCCSIENDVPSVIIHNIEPTQLFAQNNICTLSQQKNKEKIDSDK